MIVETAAAMFGMSIDDLVKIITAVTAAISTLVSVVTTMLVRLRGAKKRTFVKIRRIEAILENMNDHGPTNPTQEKLIAEMKADQRDKADAKDGYDH